MEHSNRTTAEEVELDVRLIRAVLILGTALFVVFILGVGLSF